MREGPHPLDTVGYPQLFVTEVNTLFISAKRQTCRTGKSCHSLCQPIGENNNGTSQDKR